MSTSGLDIRAFCWTDKDDNIWTYFGSRFWFVELKNGHRIYNKWAIADGKIRDAERALDPTVEDDDLP